MLLLNQKQVSFTICEKQNWFSKAGIHAPRPPSSARLAVELSQWRPGQWIRPWINRSFDPVRRDTVDSECGSAGTANEKAPSLPKGLWNCWDMPSRISAVIDCTVCLLVENAPGAVGRCPVCDSSMRWVWRGEASGLKCFHSLHVAMIYAAMQPWRIYWWTHTNKRAVPYLNLMFQPACHNLNWQNRTRDRQAKSFLSFLNCIAHYGQVRPARYSSLNRLALYLIKLLFFIKPSGLKSYLYFENLSAFL